MTWAEPGSLTHTEQEITSQDAWRRQTLGLLEAAFGRLCYVAAVARAVPASLCRAKPGEAALFIKPPPA